MPLSPASRVALLDLARGALLERLATDPARPTPPTDAELLQPAGCFVSLHERGSHRLRGCVGRIDSRQPLWEAVRHTAADVLNDPRFRDAPVTADDIPLLEIEVSVLSPPRQAATPLDFDPLRDGIYLVHEGKSGFFLPQVARQTGWTRQELLDRLCAEKLCLAADVWQKPEAKLMVFAVEVVGPEPV